MAGGGNSAGGAQPWVLRVHTQAKAAGVKLATYPRQPGHDQERAAGEEIRLTSIVQACIYLDRTPLRLSG